MEQDIAQLPPPPPIFPATSSLSKRKAPMTSTRPPPPRPIHTPASPMASTIPHNMLPSAPASPPTPAPSPTPLGRAPDWSTAAEHEDANVRHVRSVFVEMNDAEKQRLLAELLNLCSSQQLAFVQDFVSPRLKKDPFMTFPDEICLRVRSSFQFITQSSGRLGGEAIYHPMASVFEQRPVQNGRITNLPNELLNTKNLVH
jgi:F-box and WD-40 domain protein CDC4